MRTRLAVAAAAATLTALAPAAHAVDQVSGLSCGMLTSNDPTGQLVQDPNRMTGLVWAGPVGVRNTGLGAISDVSIDCVVKINYGVNDGGGAEAQRGSTTAGNVGALATTITYTAVPGDDVYLCTVVSWNGSKGHGEYRDDANGRPSDGIQCDFANSIEAAGSRQDVVAQHEMPPTSAG